MPRGTLDQALSIFTFRLLDFHRLRCAFPDASARLPSTLWPVLNPKRRSIWFGLFPFRSPLLRKSILSFSSSGYLDVSVPRVSLLTHYVFMCGYLSITLSGFPHSDIPGSMFACNSPRLFAACHVLHRLLVPRHPPYALYNLTIMVYLTLVFIPTDNSEEMFSMCFTLTYTVFKVQYFYFPSLPFGDCFAITFRHSFLVEK